jgi:hypothetical protein
VGANRVVRGVRSGHPCGNPALSETDERLLRVAIVREALAALRTPVSGPTLFESAAGS